MTTPATDTSMRAAVIEGAGVLAVRDVERPRPGAGEVLVQIEWCGVCGTDLHAVLEGWSAPGTVAGHEWSGRIAELGAGVTGWQPDDLVVGGPPSCGECRWCRAGRPALCAADPVRTGDPGHGGAFAQFHVHAAAALSRVPAGLDARTAALAEPLAVALHGLTIGGLRDSAADTRILVSGAGPLGLLVVGALVARGAIDIVVVEPSAARRAQALRVGAGQAVGPDDLPAAPDLPTQCRDDGFDIVFECSGQAAAIGTALALLVPTGRLVLLGTGSMSVRLDPIRILLNELVVTGAYCYDAHGIDDALELLASGRLPVEQLAGSDDVPLDQLLDAMRRLHAGEIPTKVLVRP